MPFMVTREWWTSHSWLDKLIAMSVMGHQERQVAADLRKHIANGQGKTMNWALENGSDFSVTLEPDIDYRVRATKNGVSITLDECGYVDRVTGGDRASIKGKDHQHVIAEVDKLRMLYQDDKGSPLPGET